MKRISAQAYEALREALPTITWNKRPYESFLRAALRDSPELLIQLDFGLRKRDVADQLVNYLIDHEDRYQDTAINLMLDVAAETEFRNIKQMKDPEERALRLHEAEDAVGRLRIKVAPYREASEAHARAAAKQQKDAANRAHVKQLSDELAAMRDEYTALHKSGDPHARGKALERLLSRLFLHFDMEPRLSYRLEREEIDGSLSFDTDDYIVEARWREERTGPDHMDRFAKKVERKGRNALGIFASINGFTSGALEEYESASPFIVITGDDLYLVLDGRVELDVLLRAKKRHVNETGDCYFPARDMVD